jgi:2',3'-cyclic-nucleotide 2'-phosphodiesterase (5'-nucleotidase family)
MRDPIEVAREMVPELRKQADLVAIVSHCGHEVEWQIAREVPGVDLIVGAHSHKRFPHAVYVAADRPGPTDPPGTVYVQAHQWGGELGRLDLTLREQTDGRWRVSRYAPALVPVTKQYAEDPQVARTVARYWDQIKARYGAVVGQATGEFTEAIGQDYTNYYLVADAVQQALGTQFDLENRSGVRAPILAGPITMGDIIGVDPFDNTLVTYKIKGSDLKRVLARWRPSTSASLRYEVRYEATAAGMGSGGTDARARRGASSARPWMASPSRTTLSIPARPTRSFSAARSSRSPSNQATPAVYAATC